MKFETIFQVLILSLVISSCTVEPVAINYGQDACHFCKMNIVDRQHAAELVTTKGKAYKYDAIECMVQDLHNWSESDIAFYLITDYDSPGTLIDARKATYIICEDIPSPMGANLSGFELVNKAEQILNHKKGELYSWSALRKHMDQSK